MNDIFERLREHADSNLWSMEDTSNLLHEAAAEIQRLRGVVAAVEREVATLDKHGPGPYSCCHAYGDEIAEDIRSVMQAALT